MSTITEWLHRYDRLHIFTGDAGRYGPAVRIRRVSGLVHFIVAGFLLLLTVGILWLVFHQIYFIGFGFLTFLFALSVLAETRTRPLLRDPLLAQAALEAGRTLGRSQRRGRWLITGPVSGVIGAELLRLNDLAGPADARDRTEQEQRLWDEAGPELRRFLHPGLGAGVPSSDVDSATYLPGETTIGLDHPQAQ